MNIEDNKRFIIFLDIDGPLCSYEHNIYTKKYAPDDEHYFLESAVNALNKIIDFYDADLCMISSWNSKFKDEEHYKKFLISRNIHVNNLYIGAQHSRCEYILEQIELHNLKFYLIIDDEAYEYYSRMRELQYKRILKPDRNRGLDDYDVKYVTKNFTLNI